MTFSDASDEIFADGAEAGAGAIPHGGGRRFTMDDLFVPEITAMHGVAVDAQSRGLNGHLWEIDPAYGQGTYWFYPVDGEMAIAVFNLEFSQEVSFGCDTPDLFCLGSYGRNMVPYFGITDEPGDRTILGYVWKGKPYLQRVRPHERLDVVSISMFLPAFQKLCMTCHCDPVELSRALASLDGTRDVAGLGILLDEIRRARPSARCASAYYRSKVVEAACLLLDWASANPHPEHAIRLADHAALNVARAYLNEHLDATVSTETLCQLTCMSASKLTRLFKRAEGVTPQEYARMLRMGRACELLENPELSLASIAEALGFARQGSFSEAFKERFDVTPSAYRKARCSGQPKGINA